MNIAIIMAVAIAIACLPIVIDMIQDWREEFRNNKG